MTQMIINNGQPFTISGYNRHTQIYEGHIISSGTFNIPSISSYSSITAMALTTITDLKIKIDDNVIYHLENLNAHISNISENLYDEEVSISVNIVFSEETEEPEE